MVKDYSKGKIYTIRSYTNDDIYIGSTIQTLTDRKASHTRDYKGYLIQKANYVSSYEILKYNDYYIELLELYPCSCLEELKKREGHFIRKMKCVNKNIPGRTQAEYYIDNKDKLLKYQEEYNNDNKDKINKYKKEHYQKNANEIKKKTKEYYHLNKTHLNSKQECECGGKYTNTHKSCHMKSNKHQNYINSLN